MARWADHFRLKRFRLKPIKAMAVLGTVGVVFAVVMIWQATAEKRVRVIRSGQLVRGAWQHPRALRAIIAREHIKTIVSLAAINPDDPKYVSQADVVTETGVRWILIPMRGSTATLEQMAEAADLLADPARQPIFFHCVAGHHRTSLAHAAYLIRHGHFTAEEAWAEVSRFPWSRPGAPADESDRSLIQQFASAQSTLVSARDALVR
jgi:protein tyrosine phosphatase (PTP) superfamily phosphohydrolase (DUF442 family)